MNALRAAVMGLLVLSCGGADPQQPAEVDGGPLEPPRASGTEPLPSCPEGEGPLQLAWSCTIDGTARMEVNAELEDGSLKLQLQGAALPAYRPVQVSLDVEPDGRADAVISGRTDGTGALVIEQYNATCAEHLAPVRATSDLCELSPAALPTPPPSTAPPETPPSTPAPAVAP